LPSSPSLPLLPLLPLLPPSLSSPVTYSAPSQCKWGPSFWCQNEATAKQCGQLTYCQTTVWKITEQVEQVKQPEDAECELCEMIVDIVEKYVNDNNKTEDEVEKLVKDACSKLGGFAEECNALVDQFFPMIWKLMEEEAPKEVCTLIGLCTTKLTAKKVQKLMPVSKPEGLECDFCKYVVDEAVKLAEENQTEEFVKDELEKFCSALGHLEAECKDLIGSFFDMIWEAILDGLTAEEIWQKIKLCSAGALLAQKTPVSKPEGVECEFCKVIVGKVLEYAKENKTKDEVKAELEQYCSDLSFLQSECKSMIDDYFDEIWDLLLTYTTAEEICEQIGLCSASVLLVAPKADFCDVCKDIVEYLQTYADSNATEEEVKEVIESFCTLFPEMPDQCKEILENFDEYWDMFKGEVDGDTFCYQFQICTSKKKIQTRTVPKKEEDTLCDLCNEAVVLLKPYVDNPDTEADAEAALKDFCNALPDADKDQCNTLLNEYFPIIWDLLKSEIDDGKICEMIGLCPSAKTQTKPKKKEQSFCDDCKSVVEFLKSYIDDNVTEEDVKDVLVEICDLLPADDSKQCLEYVDTYFPIIWDLVKQEVDSGVICEQLGFCNSTTLVAVLKAQAMAPKTIKCEACHAIVRMLRPLVDSTTVEGVVKVDLKFVCDRLPSQYKTECLNFLDQDYQLIWAVFRDEVDDGELCGLLKFCTSATLPKVEVAVAKQASKAPEIPGLCQLCEFVVGELEKKLFTNSSEAYLLGELNKICNDTPVEWRKDCKDFVEKYGKDIIKLVLEGVGPKLVCTAIQACSLVTKTETVSFDSKSETDCEVCQMIIGYLKNILGQNSTEGVVVDALVEICTVLFPEPLQDECSAFVKEYGAQVVQLILEDIDPKEICQKIDLCPKLSSSDLASPWKKIERAFKHV
ncbi:Prosaposin, partial [Geodia barretti]